jgi:excinuclease ABC subunit C
LPSSPGVYWFIGENADVLYVGKAKNLSNRLKSYSRINYLLPKTKQLVENTKQVKYQILDSELQALLIEAELIRTHQPQYNVLLKDDKSPLYIVITKEEFPKVLPVRRSDLQEQGDIRRTFGPFPSNTQVKTVLKLARRLFPFCNATDIDRRKGKACFYYHIGLCPGACVNGISPKDYQKNISRIELFLSGRHKKILEDVTKEINQFSRNQNYEQAQIAKAQHDSVNYVITHYRLSQQHHPLPQLSQDQSRETLLALRHMLYQHGLDSKSINRIEAYDVANLMGQSAAVSMVVAEDGKIAKDHYRHFKIKTLKTPNDVGMLKEAIIRRQNHPEWGIPDLMLIDGGKTQLNGVKSIMQWPIPVISIAKHPDRIFLSAHPGHAGNFFVLDPTHPGAKLLIALRDEAHRFSRRLHHRLDLDKLFLVR